MEGWKRKNERMGEEDGGRVKQSASTKISSWQNGRVWLAIWWLGAAGMSAMADGSVTAHTHREGDGGEMKGRKWRDT